MTLTMLTGNPNGLPFSAIADRLGISNTSATRLLQGLIELGYCVHQGDRYRLGPAATGLSRAETRQQRFERITEPLLDELCTMTANTAVAIFWTRHHMLCTGRVIADDAAVLQQPGFVSHRMRFAPWGWIFEPPAEWDPPDPRKGIDPEEPSKLQVTRELRRLKRHGYTWRKQPDRRRLAAPVYDRDGSVLGALGLGGSARTMPDERVADIGEQLARVAATASAALTASA